MLHVNCLPFAVPAPRRVQSHIGNGVSFLNRTLSAKMFSPNANAEGRCGCRGVCRCPGLCCLLSCIPHPTGSLIAQCSLVRLRSSSPLLPCALRSPHAQPAHARLPARVQAQRGKAAAEVGRCCGCMDHLSCSIPPGGMPRQRNWRLLTGARRSPVPCPLPPPPPPRAASA